MIYGYSKCYHLWQQFIALKHPPFPGPCMALLHHGVAASRVCVGIIEEWVLKLGGVHECQSPHQLSHCLLHFAQVHRLRREMDSCLTHAKKHKLNTMRERERMKEEVKQSTVESCLLHLAQVHCFTHANQETLRWNTRKRKNEAGEQSTDSLALPHPP